MSFQILKAAELEAIEAALWYDEQRPNLGDEFLDEIATAFDGIRQDPRGMHAWRAIQPAMMSAGAY